MVRRLGALIGLAALVLAAGCRAHPEPPATEWPRGSSAQSLTVAGVERTYRLYVPPALSLDTPVALVVMMHGGFGTGQQAEDAYGWDAKADAAGFVVAFPDGANRAWSVGGGCCGEPGRRGTNDVTVIEAIVDAIAATLPVDPTRVYAAGMSNGAMMSYRLACDSTRFAAVAPVAGTLMGDCPAPKPVSLLHIHGLADDNVPFDGRPGTGFAKVDGPSVPTSIDVWRAACAAPAETTAGPVTTAKASCPGGREVTLITIAAAGHQWPGGESKPVLEKAMGIDPPSTALDATAMIWDFFAGHHS
ncbi:PHB depolymerase family esterase [Dactylosporangium sp. NPDC050688]|uniref:extracellular catalytic domain type 1 short-chain-length polyhydroxyalkanoate depolymerase n=1 Tax=Dactylosporangium sp. NPDC050688 TaxID=3157217 RepID=UPI0033F9C3F0